MRTSTVARGAIAAGAAAGAVYAGYVAATWLRYGRTRAPAHPDDSDRVLDRFMPRFEVSDRHHIDVAAPAHVTLAAAEDVDLSRSPVVSAIFKGREWIMRSHPDDRPQPRGLLAQMQALGWGVLADEPGREIVLGAVTKPWEPNPVFRALPAGEFEAFSEPDYTKIIWTLRADPAGPSDSIFRTETRAATTDAMARARFRLYWACLSPGIRLIRMAILRQVKREAEARVRPAIEAVTP